MYLRIEYDLNKKKHDYKEAPKKVIMSILEYDVTRNAIYLLLVAIK